jgi:hypothetical protein
MGVSGQLHAPTALSPGERAPGAHWVGGWAGPRAGLDAVNHMNHNGPRSFLSWVSFSVEKYNLESKHTY